jgi:predicted nucleotidyltransferase
VALGDSGPESDVDLLAEFNLTLFSLSGVRLRLSDVLGMPVDLAGRRTLKDQVKVRSEREPKSSANLHPSF